MDIPCPICNTGFKDRIRIHLIQKHGIQDPDASTLKSLLIHFSYFPEDKTTILDIKKILGDHGFRYEKLRIER